MRAVILAGGERPERFKTYILGKRVIDYPLEALKESYDVHVLTSGWTVDDVPMIVQKRSGVIGAILDAVEALGLPLLISYGDIVAEKSFYLSLRETCSVSAVASVPSSRHGKIGDPQGSYVFAGLLYLDDTCFDELVKTSDLMVAINNLIKEGKLKVSYFDGTWHDVDAPEDVIKIFPDIFSVLTRGYSMIGEEMDGVMIKGRVVIERGASVEPGAVLIGPAYVGRGSIVEANSVVKRSAVEPGGAVESFSAVVESSVQPGGRAEAYKRYVGQVIF
ncbi:MAG: NDP-sugar synthase [Crenarchaeota archaeon]|nr:NDP-sugar synthase [Thermoproteota archaeon]